MNFIKKLNPRQYSQRTLVATLIISSIAGIGAWRVWEVGAASMYSASYDETVHTKINSYRTNKGVKPVRESTGCLLSFAKASAYRMAMTERMTHADNLSNVFSKCDVPGGIVGENIARGPEGGAFNSSVLVSSWINSTSHCRNILNSKYEVGAVVSYRGASGRVYTASWFYGNNSQPSSNITLIKTTCG